MDMNQWILSKDMAKWISRRQPLPVSDEINCILSAPHRSLKEKLEGLKLLEKKHTGLADQVLWMESLVEWAYMDTGTVDTHDLYETEIFCRGVRDEFMEKKIFQNAISARESVREQIASAAREDGASPEQYCAVLYRYQAVPAKAEEYRNIWNFIIDFRGEPIYCLPEPGFPESMPPYSTDELPEFIWNWDDHFLRIPYPSGTVVEIRENPYSPPIKGILVNEDDFGKEEPESGSSGQWFLYPDYRCVEQTGGIGAVNLEAGPPLMSVFGILPPSRQFFGRCEGNLTDREAWLLELGRMVRRDPEFLKRILSGRQPGSRSLDLGRLRLEYVKKLWEKGQ